MPLLSIFASNPEAVGELTVEQIVSSAGDGALKDHSTCSTELREYLGQIDTSTIAKYLDYCLNTAFAKSGMVLQDLVNELGRRLDYEVRNGRYQGVVNAVGYDGLWRSPERHSLIIEVKTTDAYRISLDTLAVYRSKLIDAGEITEPSSVLIVVGRVDTGELEAQIRGSRHAWDIRVISAEALIKLVLLKENTEAAETGLKIRSLLTPIEYTRLDRMVDVMFTTVTDVEEAPGAEEAVNGQDGLRTATGDADASGGALTSGKTKGVWQFTDAGLMQAKREEVIAALARREKVSLVRKSRALYWDPQHHVRAACAMSKRYAGKNRIPYWYAYHPAWEEFLSEGDAAYFVLGGMDLDVGFAIPHATFAPLVAFLNSTTTDKGTYWHIHLMERPEGLALSLPKKTDILKLSPYEFNLKSTK